MSDIREIKSDIKDIRADVKDVIVKVDNGFNMMDDRVKNLELKQAERQGRDSVMTANNMGWKKLTGSLVVIIGTALSIAYVVADRVLK